MNHIHVKYYKNTIVVSVVFFDKFPKNFGKFEDNIKVCKLLLKRTFKIELYENQDYLHRISYDHFFVFSLFSII